MPDELNLLNVAFLALIGVVAIKFPKVVAIFKAWMAKLPPATVQVPPAVPMAPLVPGVSDAPPPVVATIHPVREAMSKLMVDLAAKEKAAVEALRTEAAAKVAAAGGA